MRILLVDDNPWESKPIKSLLEEHGFVVDAVGSAREAIAYAREYSYAAGIFDLYLTNPPRTKDGLELIGQIRSLRREYCPVLVLTHDSTVETEIIVFEAGANEFIPKANLAMPKVMLVRLHAMIQAAQRLSLTSAGMILERGPIILDVFNSEVRVNGEEMMLTRKEYLLLKYLMVTGRPVSTTELINHLWDVTQHATSNYVQVLVSRVRAKLREKLGWSEDDNPIPNARNVQGYVLHDFSYSE